LTARDEFPPATRQTVAQRVNYQCSRPGCRAATSGPQSDSRKALNVGVAAHITAAAKGGPRYDPNMTPAERSNIENAIWLCQTCAKLVDNDPARFGAVLLCEWKEKAETLAFELVGKTAEGDRRVDFAEFEVIGRFGIVHTVYVSPIGLEDRDFVAQVLHAISSKVDGSSILEVMLFDDRNFTPQGLPMTDEQLRHYRARYIRNPNTGFAKFAWLHVADSSSPASSLSERTDSIRPGYAGDD
jgi:hypothetical protein